MKREVVEVVGTIKNDNDFWNFENYSTNVVLAIDELLEIDSQDGDMFKITIEKLN